MTINKAGYFFVCLIWLIHDLLIPFLAINEFFLGHSIHSAYAARYHYIAIFFLCFTCVFLRRNVLFPIIALLFALIFLTAKYFSASDAVLGLSSVFALVNAIVCLIFGLNFGHDLHKGHIKYEHFLFMFKVMFSYSILLAIFACLSSYSPNLVYNAVSFKGLLWAVPVIFPNLFLPIFMTLILHVFLGKRITMFMALSYVFIYTLMNFQKKFIFTLLFIFGVIVIITALIYLPEIFGSRIYEFVNHIKNGDLNAATSYRFEEYRSFFFVTK